MNLCHPRKRIHDRVVGESRQDRSSLRHFRQGSPDDRHSARFEGCKVLKINVTTLLLGHFQQIRIQQAFDYRTCPVNEWLKVVR